MANPLQFSRRGFVHALAVISAQGFSSVTNFLMGVLLARACSRGQYGIYVQCIAFLSIVSGIQLSLAAYPYTIRHPQLDGIGQKTYLGSILVLQLGIVCMVALLFLVGASGLSLLGGVPSVVGTIWVLSVAGPVFLMRDSATAMILARLHIWRNFAMVVGGSVATITGLAACYATGRLTVPVAFLVFAACMGIPIAFTVLLGLWSDARVCTECFRGDIGQNWRIGKWLVARTFANMAAVSIFPFLLGSFHGAQAAAIYGVCLTYANLLNPLIIGVARFFRPRAAHACAADPRRLQHMTVLCVCGLSLLLAVFLAVTIGWGGRLLTVMFGPKYQGLEKILVLAVVANSIGVLSGPLAIAIDVRERTGATLRGRLVGCAISVVLGVFLVKHFGPLGAVVALSLSWAGTGLYYLREFRLLGRLRQELHHEQAAASA